MAIASYVKNIGIEQKFTPTIKSILGNQFITKDIELDEKEGTDFLILSVKPFRVAVRLRRWEYINYIHQFTIRWKSPSGLPTEIDKIRKGYVDYLLYGFLNEDETKIIRYFIGDLKIFREHYSYPILIKDNNPPDSKLAVFEIKQFPTQFIIKNYSSPEYIKLCQDRLKQHGMGI